MKKTVIYSVVGLLLSIVFALLIWDGQEYLSLFPAGLLAIYFAIFQTEKLFISIAFFTPLSINIEEFNSSFGLFLPSEPLLFGLMIWLSALQLYRPFMPKNLWREPILFSVGIFLTWIFISSITSSHPIVSFKFLLAKLWFIVPVLFFGIHFFQKEKNRVAFIWLFLISSCIVVIYTITRHALFAFGEKESHWVMSPFFKDHTIYGAIIALNVPLVFGLYLYKKHAPLIQAVIIAMIVLILAGLYFSYTRAAWLSVFGCLIIGGLIYYKVNWKPLAGIAAIALLVVLFKWDSIEMELARNKQDHTTESFDERLQSAANISTDASNLERINRWSCALAMFEERPVFGYGPGTYAFEYAPFQEPENLTIISTNFGDMGNAHSEYLGALAEMGIIGLLSFLGIVATIFYTSIMVYNRIPVSDTGTRILILSMIMALSTYFIHAFLNNFLDTDKAAVPVFGMCAMIIALGLQQQKLASDPK
ncbi:MAG: O-antigen ligase family protein [Crocinitomicaceae bacterium]|nr:O-antigen ligase family protein [Crocinitomicaceae bacterium]MBP6033723.1 O-antigen ligase family protein [Crocinitomicaceae bacterium]